MTDFLSTVIETHLKEALEKFLKTPDGETPPNLESSIRYSLLAPGKRIRPRLALACAQMIDLPQAAVMPAACAIEMIHCFTLIHDDLPCMDNDDFRRGKPSNHKVHGEGIALLAGDALMSLAIDVYLDAQPHVSSDSLLTGLKRLNWAMGPRGVIGGQGFEPLLTSLSSLQLLRQMHAQKTGALFSAALLIPRDLKGICGTSPRGLAIEQFAHELGLAFQVVDDLEDATETHPPTSILHFMSSQEAQTITRKSLESAMSHLEAQWKETAHPLLNIAQEVLNKL